jgi:hypothetical protein
LTAASGVHQQERSPYPGTFIVQCSDEVRCNFHLPLHTAQSLHGRAAVPITNNCSQPAETLLLLLLLLLLIAL